jgi:hypothetical protein
VIDMTTVAFDAAGVAVYATCSWCHALNPVDEERCHMCGHAAHVDRARCRCGRPGCFDAEGRYVPNRLQGWQPLESDWGSP